ncbi:MAG: M13 family peptidase [Sphingobacteriales bacterium]|nr:MAG: M13 family peptidase [Sphingobacteriales bacterium]
MKTISAPIFLVTFLTVIYFTACNNTSQPTEKTPDLIASYRDTTVNPGDDFFHYAVGTWVKNNPIPAAENSWGIWSLVNEESFTRLRLINEEAATQKDAAKGSNAQKIGDFWFTGMDSTSIEQQGITKLQPELDLISGVKDKPSLIDELAHLQMIGAGALYEADVYQDEMKSDKEVLHFSQGGIGLPNRDYYFDMGERFVKIRAEYLLHVAKMLQLMGEDSIAASKNATAMMKLETSLAKASRKLEDLRDPYKNYNKMSVEAFSKITPSLNWKLVLDKMNIKNIDSVIVGQPEFYKQVEASMKSVSMNDWQTYLRYNLISSFAPYISSNFDKENFHFYRTVLNGVKEQRPRWKRVLYPEEGLLGEALGQLYVQKYFSEKTKHRYEKLVDDVFAAYKERFQNLTWMSDSTKQKAIYKLSTVTKKVGYPDKWKDYSAMNIGRSSYVENVIAGNIWNYNYAIAKLYKPVDRTEWDMTPQTWNAYYNPSNNEIVLPAAIFIIPGLPDSLADDAIVYGYAGASTIGHEITHGFDDQGRQFDEKGNLRNWWSKEDENEFTSRAHKLVTQFSGYTVLDSMHVNGEASLGENLADLGGIVICYDAFKKTDEYKKNEMISGMTPSQRYFLGYALSWMGHARDESLAQQIKTDVHSPNFLRVNGPFSDVDAFYDAYSVKPCDKMYLADSLRAKIW